MDVSPFPYQGPLQPHEVRGRDDLVADLVERLTEHRVTALLGPRRFGKTSVLRKVAAELTEVAVVWIDLYGALTHADLAARFAAGLDAARATADSVIEDAAVAAKVNLGLVQVELARPVRDRPDPASLFTQLTGVLVEAAARTPLVVVLDEFQAIADVDGATAVLRTAFQHHLDTMGLVFAGSEPSTMRQLFTARSQPFFGQADLVTIGPLDLGTVVALVRDGFASTGRTATAPIAGRVFDMTLGHPQRTMELADAVWRAAGPDGTADDAAWRAAVDDVRRRTAAIMTVQYAGFATDQKKVLRAYASGGSPFGTAGSRLDLLKAGATHARDALLATGELVSRDDEIQVTDPFLADWLRRTLPA